MCGAAVGAVDPPSGTPRTFPEAPGSFRRSPEDACLGVRSLFRSSEDGSVTVRPSPGDVVGSFRGSRELPKHPRSDTASSTTPLSRCSVDPQEAPGSFFSSSRHHRGTVRPPRWCPRGVRSGRSTGLGRFGEELDERHCGAETPGVGSSNAVASLRFPPRQQRNRPRRRGFAPSEGGGAHRRALSSGTRADDRGRSLLDSQASSRS